MPTVEQIKKITIVGESRGLDKLSNDTKKLSSDHQQLVVASKALEDQTASASRALVLYNDAMVRQSREIAVYNRAMLSANDNSRAAGRSFGETAEETLKLANHAKQAAVALYAISPAFRSLVNPAITASAKATSQALIAMGPAAASATMAFARGLSPVIAAASRVLLPLSLMKSGLDLTTEAWSLGGKELEKYRGIAEKAAAVDLSTSYFQRITKAATDAKLPVDTLTKALQNLQSSTTEELDGSALSKKLNEHLKAGNLGSNGGVDAIGLANTTEDKFKAVVRLIDEANQKGERLAALDIANTVFGPEITARLRQNSEYLHDLQASAEKISATQLVSDADIGRALDLQRRYDAAVAILEQRWHPIQGLLTQQGVKMQTSWVGIVASIANAVDGASNLAIKLGEIPAPFWSYIQKGASAVSAVAPGIGGAFGPAGLAVGRVIGAGAGLIAGEGESGPIDARTAAFNRLSAGLKNHSAVAAAGALALGVYDNVIKDTSKNLGDHAEKQNESADAVDRAINSWRRQIEMQKASVQAIGLDVGAQAALRVAAAQTAAVLANGGKITDEQAKAFARLKDEASGAALALAKARIDDKIKFDRETAFFSQQDVAIARELAGIYPNISDAMKSVEAHAVRVNDSLRPLNDNAAPSQPQQKDEAA